MKYWIDGLREAIETLPPGRHRSIALTELENVEFRVEAAVKEAGL